MNCKPGDLAIMVSSEIQENIGLIFEVISLHIEASNEYGKPVWNITSPRKTMSGDGELSQDGIAFDSQLRPITGLPITDDVTDEVAA